MEPIRKSITSLKLLKADAGGRSAEFGLGIDRQPQGVALGIDTGDIGDFAAELLASGNALMAAGAPAAELSTNAVRLVLGCTQMAVMTSTSGEAVLALGFGAHTICVKVNTSEVSKALSLLHAAAQGGLHQPTRAD